MVHRHAEHAAGHRAIEQEKVGAAVNGETRDGRNMVVVLDDIAAVCARTCTDEFQLLTTIFTATEFHTAPAQARLRSPLPRRA